jgi:hypothetical protein
MSEDFNLKTLICMVRAVRTLTQRGDNLPKPLAEDHRQILIHAVQGWIDRIVNTHMAPTPEDPDVSLRDLIGLAKACDAFIVKGDGLGTPLSDPMVGVTFAARQVLLGRASQHPNGDLVVENAVQNPIAISARVRAGEARRASVATAEAARPTIAPVAPASPPPPATPAEVVPNLDAFQFAAAPAVSPEDRPPTAKPVEVEPEPLDLGPTKPVPVSLPETGQPQA